LIKRLFISKDLTELAHLPAFCAEHSIDLIAQSCIQFSAVPFVVKKPFEVVFFGSVRAASFFLSSYSLPNVVEIACIGETTAEKLRALNLPVSFVGAKAGNPSEVGQDFKAWLGKRCVLFPLSAVSKESIVKVVPEIQSEKVIVYETLAKEIQRVNLDLAIFTSPSNLESFLQAGNKVPRQTIAWGNTTFQAMIASEIQATSTLATSTELELISVLSKLITQ
jgi:uroporphyrinogen-III synthase